LNTCRGEGSCVSYENYKHTIVYSSETNKFYYIPVYTIYLKNVFERWFELLVTNQLPVNFTVEEQIDFIKKHILQTFDLDVGDNPLLSSLIDIRGHAWKH